MDALNADYLETFDLQKKLNRHIKDKFSVRLHKLIPDKKLRETLFKGGLIPKLGIDDEPNFPEERKRQGEIVPNSS